MINLPKAIGQLKNLRIFNASKNQLESIPESITSLKKLKAINLSHNRLDYLPKGMGTLPNLIILILNHNQLTNLPRELANLNDLITLNVSNNPLKTIPAEIATLKSLRKLIAEDCAFEQEFVHDLKHDPPSLFEICARNIISSDTPLPPSLASSHIADYFKREQLCSFCYGPYFDSFVTRGRFIERTGRQILALDYKLCCAHWTNEEDRIQAMFSTPYYKQSYLQPQHVESVSIPSAAALEDISTIPLSSPMTTTASLTGVETQQVDYFGTIRSSNNRSSSSSEDMLPSPLISPTDSFTDSMDSFTPYSGPLSPSSPTIISSQQQHHPQQRPAFNNTNTSSSSSTAAAVATRPRSSSTSSSSLLRIHAMHQQLQHNISAALLRKQQRQQQEILGGNSGTGGDVVLPFASLNGRQSEEADMILLSRNQLITTSLDGEVTAEPSSTRPQLQQSSSNGSSSVRSKKSGKAAIKEGFASLGAKLGGGSRKGARDRSETF
jgi:Leucine-rich repeat (LRR) protein